MRHRPILLIAVLAGCGAAASDADPQLADLQSQIDALAQSNQELREELAQLATAAQLAEVRADVGQLQTEVEAIPQWVAKQGYATESFVAGRGYLQPPDLAGYATQAFVTGQGYLLPADLSGYATRTWVDGKGYAENLGDYVTVDTRNDLVLVEGANVQLVSGLGSTWQSNGLGNLIVGYNIDPLGFLDRSGSHNVVVGDHNAYGSYGGLVVGQHNEILGPWAAVTGGTYNVASGYGASVCGGDSNRASGERSVVLGGGGNIASGTASVVGGGLFNGAAGEGNVIVGGSGNLATSAGTCGVVVAGLSNVVQDDYAVVLGTSNVTSADPYTIVP